ncbi:CPBP family intramembrane metalloprotease [Candidatus Gottesmanbacteria bacterium]|nr:CPBP family intramembrane metalloprotease [Candidatus Gottesmanbacteria bacterium]
MNALYSFLLILYTTIPPISLFYTLTWIYRDKRWYGIHLQYAFKYLITLSFLPLLSLPEVSLGITPTTPISWVMLVVTFALAVAGIRRAIRRNVLFFYLGGVTAAFVEEILYRGIIFGLLLAMGKNTATTVIVSSLAFGLWHLKNIPWLGKRSAVIQCLYTALVGGPIFAGLRLLTGDIYAAILFHYLVDATCALAPDWMRGWLIFGGKGAPYEDAALSQSRIRGRTRKN